MQSRVCRLYAKGDLRVETDSVEQPGPGEVLVNIGRGGICGSDLHYFLDGGFGPVRVQEPIIMGHEFAGVVEELGPDIENLEVGDRVGINPSQPCGSCCYCLESLPQHCLNMRFIGSAFRLPHEQGGFREKMIVNARQCVKGDPDTPLAELACAEPLSVCLHAAKNAGPLEGKKVLVNGAGPIGALAVAVAKFQNAQEIVVVDLFGKTLSVALQMGAGQVLDIARNSSVLDDYARDKGYFDTVFECSAAQAAMGNIFRVVRPCGSIVQVGVTGELQVPINALVGKEITWTGSHRFHAEYADAVALISAGRIDVSPIITDVYPMEEIMTALESAADRSRSVKVQLDFGS